MKTKICFTSVLTACASGIICLYYTVYLLLCAAGFDSWFMCLFSLCVIAGVSLPVLFAEKLKKKLGRAFLPLRILFTVLLLCYIVTVILFWCYIGFDAAKTPEAYLGESNGENTLILIFGCRAYDHTPSQTLALRLDAAYALLSAMPEAVCIVSGGQGSNETVPEAIVMKSYLEARGIDSSRIFTESESHSTSENVRFSKELIQSLNLTEREIIGVSTSFHLPRIEMLSQRYELPMKLCAAPSPTFAHHYVSMVREYLSYIKMMLFDQAVLITKIT